LFNIERVAISQPRDFDDAQKPRFESRWV